MNKMIFRLAALTAVAVLLAALPATAQIIPAGDDRWVTPNDGGTFFTFPAGDVESLCGLPATSGWNRQITLTGVPSGGADWDTVVTRLKDADLSTGSASVPIQVTQMHFRSSGVHVTPCGKLLWEVKAIDHQPVTKMAIYQTSDLGGIFKAEISVRVAFSATKTDGTALGELFYTRDLPENGGTPWSWDRTTGTFRPGIDEDENCFDVLRDKIGTLPARHKYYIENLIAQGKCDKRQ